MDDKKSTKKNKDIGGEIDPPLLNKSYCVDVIQTQNDHLNYLCSKKVNKLIECGDSETNSKCCDGDCATINFQQLIKPCISVKYGDSTCDCIETDDVEVLCITVCNCYTNITFRNFSIGQILVTPVQLLPDGTPSVQVIPSGPICFGDIEPCHDKPTCVSREFIVYTRGAIGGGYKLLFDAICYDVCHQFQTEQCFIMELCQDEQKL